jgi:cephalosporin-C deacetylase
MPVPQFDLSLPELESYRANVSEPGDFAEFWATTLADTRSHDLSATFAPVDTGLVAVETFDVEYRGFGGHRIKAWLHLPAPALRDGRRLPGVVQYQGYGGGRGLSHENLTWALAGYAHLVMDTRGQGSGWSFGETHDPVGSAPAHSGFMTRGITSPDTYFYRRVFADAVRAVEALRTHHAVDAERIAVTGGSQGGGITLAVAALVPDLVAAMPDVPFLCDFPRATTLIDEDPYGEIARYLKARRDDVEQAYTTLAYFDGVNMARHAKAPALFSVGLMDDTCPPSTVYAAYNAYAADKEIAVYPFNNHEGGQGFHFARQLRYLRDHV